jgi:hypothetical protein
MQQPVFKLPMEPRSNIKSPPSYNIMSTNIFAANSRSPLMRPDSHGECFCPFPVRKTSSLLSLIFYKCHFLHPFIRNSQILTRHHICLICFSHLIIIVLFNNILTSLSPCGALKHTHTNLTLPLIPNLVMKLLNCFPNVSLLFCMSCLCFWCTFWLC